MHIPNREHLIITPRSRKWLQQCQDSHISTPSSNLLTLPRIPSRQPPTFISNMSYDESWNLPPRLIPLAESCMVNFHQPTNQETDSNLKQEQDDGKSKSQPPISSNYLLGLTSNSKTSPHVQLILTNFQDHYLCILKTKSELKELIKASIGSDGPSIVNDFYRAISKINKTLIDPKNRKNIGNKVEVMIGEDFKNLKLHLPGNRFTWTFPLVQVTELQNKLTLSTKLNQLMLNFSMIQSDIISASAAELINKTSINRAFLEKLFENWATLQGIPEGQRGELDDNDWMTHECIHNILSDGLALSLFTKMSDIEAKFYDLYRKQTDDQLESLKLQTVFSTLRNSEWDMIQNRKMNFKIAEVSETIAGVKRERERIEETEQVPRAASPVSPSKDGTITEKQASSDTKTKTKGKKKKRRRINICN
ncbi:unnamed protein product [Ambrosiozyma monospora]|uniref:Unnamed protein product n=1 Tax=Ambrosiozyma monospora TaxID=43982 RepID=A0A9W7DFG9_AMBMO|nr:unnamed protein product [Ambrosiozyma monospora]